MYKQAVHLQLTALKQEADQFANRFREEQRLRKQIMTEAKRGQAAAKELHQHDASNWTEQLSVQVIGQSPASTEVALAEAKDLTKETSQVGACHASVQLRAYSYIDVSIVRLDQALHMLKMSHAIAFWHAHGNTGLLHIGARLTAVPNLSIVAKVNIITQKTVFTTVMTCRYTV